MQNVEPKDVKIIFDGAKKQGHVNESVIEVGGEDT